MPLVSAPEPIHTRRATPGDAAAMAANFVAGFETYREFAPPEWTPPPQVTSGMGALAYSGGTLEDQPTAYGEPGEPPAEEAPPVVAQRRVDEHETLGRNDPCWCGSGKKYKKCHGA